MIKKFKIWYLQRSVKKISHYLIDGHAFKIEKITVKQYAALVRLIDSIFTEKAEDAGVAGLISAVILKFEKLAKIIFEGQPYADVIEWNNVDGNLAYEITADVLKKNPKLMLHLKSILESLGLNAGRLAAELKKIMQLK